MYPISSIFENRPLYPNTLERASINILIISGLILAIIASCSFRISSLSQISQVDALIMISTGSFLSFSLIISRVIDSLKSLPAIDAIDSLKSLPAIDAIDSLKPPPVIYTGDSLAVWSVQAEGKIPPKARIDWRRKDPFSPDRSIQETSMLVFIPKWLVINGKKERPTLNLLIEKVFPNCKREGHQIVYYYKEVEKTIGNEIMKPGWKLFTKELIPPVSKINYEKQIVRLYNKGYRMPSVGELVFAMMLHHAHTGQRLLPGRTKSVRKEHFTLCLEKVHAAMDCSIDPMFPVTVGAFGRFGLYIQYDPSDGRLLPQNTCAVLDL